MLAGALSGLGGEVFRSYDDGGSYEGVPGGVRDPKRYWTYYITPANP